MNDKMHNIIDSYDKLSETNKTNFSRVANRLLAANYICGSRKKDRDDYFFISNHQQLLKEYLLLIGYNLYVSNPDLVAYIVNEYNYNHLNINKLYSIVLLLLRKLYFQKMKEFQDTDEIYISISDLHIEIEATGVYEKRISKTELKDVYSFLSRYNICERIGDLNNDESMLIIYPTINYILPVNSINEVEKRINNYKRGETDEEFNESEID